MLKTWPLFFIHTFLYNYVRLYKFKMLNYYMARAALKVAGTSSLDLFSFKRIEFYACLRVYQGYFKKLLQNMTLWVRLTITHPPSFIIDL